MACAAIAATLGHPISRSAGTNVYLAAHAERLAEPTHQRVVRSVRAVLPGVAPGAGEARREGWLSLAGREREEDHAKGE